MKISGQKMPAGIRCPAFSLVEITLAIGVVSFALLAVLALLPVGLGNARNAYEEAFAVQTLRAISASIQQASQSTNNLLDYTALAPFNNASQGAILHWQVGSSPHESIFYIAENGLPSPSKSEARLLACIQIIPPSDRLSIGKASVTLAWPPAGITTPILWTGSRPQLTNEQGRVESIIYFSPK